MIIEPRGVIDTNVVILLPQLIDSPLPPDEPTITSVTLAELPVGPPVVAGSTERAARQAHQQQAEADFVPLAFDAVAARALGRVAADLGASGRKPTARAFDALIAATAIANGLALYATNPSDFEAISGLEVRTVPHPDGAVS